MNPAVTANSDRWVQLTGFANLYTAWRDASRGKRHRQSVSRFACDLEEELLLLQYQLQADTYRPGPYRMFTIYERKPRVISAAPFRDRVVHHALMNVLDPQLDAMMYRHSYACRVGKGVHAAVNRYETCARRFAYVLKMDVQRYFPSIDQRILFRQLCKVVPESDIQRLIAHILRSNAPTDATGVDAMFGKGLPIGNLTSQAFANWYLTPFDHWLSRQLPNGNYLRYVDDLWLFADDKQTLWTVAQHAKAYLSSRLRLTVHPRKTALRRTSEKVDVLGYHVSRHRRWLRPDNGHRFRRRLRGMAKAYSRGEVSVEDLKPRIASWIGHAMHGETRGLRRTIFSTVRFKRATAP